MSTIFKFLILAGGALFVTVFLTSGAIGYLVYSSSNSTDIPPSIIPNWKELPEVPRQALIAGGIILAAIWVVVGGGGGSSEKEDRKPESKKGRKRRYLDED